jgi:hypothetical protein
MSVSIVTHHAARTDVLQPNCLARAALFAGVSAQTHIFRGDELITRQEEL